MRRTRDVLIRRLGLSQYPSFRILIYAYLLFDHSPVYAYHSRQPKDTTASVNGCSWPDTATIAYFTVCLDDFLGFSNSKTEGSAIQSETFGVEEQYEAHSTDDFMDSRLRIGSATTP